MKKLLLIIALIPLLAVAQEKEVVKEYCIVALEDKELPIWRLKQKPRHAYALMDDTVEPGVITNSKGEKLTFKNVVDLINYMSRQGWELHTKRTMPGNGTAYSECLFWRYKEITIEVKSGD